jgi:hypothetical protein
MISDHTRPEDQWLWLIQARAWTCFQTGISNWDQLISHLEQERTKRDGANVDQLSISGHGAGPGTGVGTSFGNPDLSITDLDYEQALRLRANLSRGAKLKFWACSCANRPESRERLQWLADTLDVEVEAAEGEVAAGADGLWGFSFGTSDPKWYTFRPGKPPIIGTGSGRSKWKKKK